jgi:hypothetical protein
MAVFEAAGANKSQPVASTYAAAAMQVNVNCGPGFVNASVPVVTSAAATHIGMGSWTGLLVLAACVLAWVL